MTYITQRFIAIQGQNVEKLPTQTPKYYSYNVSPKFTIPIIY